jgi:phosphoribosylanthranilate isomerase
MFRIKICGVTNSGDALAAIEAGADALGFNFYRSSKRFVELEQARRIADQVAGSALKVGVFVNHDAREIAEAVETVGLDCIQLHGDERPAFLAGLPADLPIVCAHRCGAQGLAPLASYLYECRELGRMPVAVLLDSDVGGAFGGTGNAADWSLIARDRAVLGDVRLILAGGLTPENVGQAIVAVRPAAVDVASGVELHTGNKDVSLMKKFVASAREGFNRL